MEDDEIKRVRIEREPYDFPISVWIVVWVLWPVLLVAGLIAGIAYILYQIILIIFLLIFRPRACLSYCISLGHKWEEVVEPKLQKYAELLILLFIVLYICYRIYKYYYGVN